ncbi:MAG: hypothetical protein JW775_04845 [Candidatus Aminicenantes bacterium]|nr:hypothetical protein [Candidatus Aminicenantes bacterium]
MKRNRALLNVLAAALTLGLFVDPIGGAFTWLHCRREGVKKEVREHIIAGVREDDLVLLRFSEEESRTRLRWEHAREFEYDGQMYDIVDTWTVGETVYYRCWWDREETRLNQRLRELAIRAFGGRVPGLVEDGGPLMTSLRSLPGLLIETRPVREPGWTAARDCAFADRFSSLTIQPPTPPPRPA